MNSQLLATAEDEEMPSQGGIDESLVEFGDDSALVGVLCRPHGASAGGPAFLMWNVGLNHRVGPYRIYVDLARALARARFASLRFDLQGLGDSRMAASDARTDSERSVADVRSAIDALERRGFRSVVLVGFCSSVDSAHSAALADERVIGVVNIEGYSFRTLGYRLRYPLRFLDSNRWARWAYHRKRRGQQEETDASSSVYERNYPTPQRLAREYRGMVERGIRFLFLYVRGDSQYEYTDQLFEFLEDRSLESHMEIEYFAEADHIFSRVPDRRKAIERVVQFAQTRFGRAALELAQSKTS